MRTPPRGMRGERSGARSRLLRREKRERWRDEALDVLRRARERREIGCENKKSVAALFTLNFTPSAEIHSPVWQSPDNEKLISSLSPSPSALSTSSGMVDSSFDKDRVKLEASSLPPCMPRGITRDAARPGA